MACSSLDAPPLPSYNPSAVPLPLPFAPPSLSDAPSVRRLIPSAVRQSDLAFANMFLLRHKYGTEIAMEGGFLFRHFSAQGRLQGYAFPCGVADPVPALRRIEEDAQQRQRPFRFCLLTEDQCELLKRLYPSRLLFHADPGDADYVYERRLLAELPGARLHRKRNHVARFKREFPELSLRPLTPELAADARAVAAAWLAAQEGDSPALFHEFEAIVHALEAMLPLSLFGVLLYVKERPVAMALASIISPQVADVHYEKCAPEFRSAYPVINQALAAALSCDWINREEDLNQPGLRQAKMSYFPSLVLTKFSAVPC